MKSIHKGCGGEIKNRVCLKCNRKWGKLNYLFTGDVTEVDESKFDPSSYRERIRKGKDIR